MVKQKGVRPGNTRKKEKQCVIEKLEMIRNDWKLESQIGEEKSWTIEYRFQVLTEFVVII